MSRGRALRLAGSGPLAGAGGTPLVAGYENSPSGRAALAFARSLGARMHAAVHVVHAVDLADYPVSSDAPGWEEAGEAALAAHLEDVRLVFGGYPGVWTFEAWSGEPGPVLAEAAGHHDAEIIVVGRSRHHRLLSADRPVGAHLARHTDRAVLIAPPLVTPGSGR